MRTNYAHSGMTVGTVQEHAWQWASSSANYCHEPTTTCGASVSASPAPGPSYSRKSAHAFFNCVNVVLSGQSLISISSRSSSTQRWTCLEKLDSVQVRRHTWAGGESPIDPRQFSILQLCASHIHAHMAMSLAACSCSTGETLQPYVDCTREPFVARSTSVEAVPADDANSPRTALCTFLHGTRTPDKCDLSKSAPTPMRLNLSPQYFQAEISYL